MVRPMLGDVELQLVQEIAIDSDQVLESHAIPALEGDFLQRLNRRANRITLSGVITGDEFAEGLVALRDKFHAAEPVDFVSDVTTATRVDQVLIEAMGVRELAGKPQRFEYAFTLVEYKEAEPVDTEDPDRVEPPDPVPNIENRTGTLVVEVVVEGQPNFDFSQVTITVEGSKEDGSAFSTTLSNRVENRWTEQNFPAGNYTAKAVATTPTETLTGSEPAVVQAGQTTTVRIVLTPGQTIAHGYIIHFTFDRAFIHPCLMHVLEDAAAYAGAHPDEKVVIVGHTDRVGSDDYNLSLGDRRARTVYAALTYRSDPALAVAEWDAIRKSSTGGLPRIQEGSGGWGVPEYQYMLQDLGFYHGPIDGLHLNITDEAVRAFQSANGLVADGIVGDATWPLLIDAYLRKYNLDVPAGQFMPNAKDGCDGGIVRWLGCGEQAFLSDTPSAPCAPDVAWRPNRRTEILFVKADEFPCEIPEPVTFRIQGGYPAGTTWCLGPGDRQKRCCFITRDEQTARNEHNWLFQPAEPGDVTVKGSIRFSDGTPLANTKYVLIAPDGRFMDGEELCGSTKGRGIPGKTDANGEFSYTTPSPKGHYVLEINGLLVARLKEQPVEEAKGNVVCKHIKNSDDAFDVIVTDLAVIGIRPAITLASDVVVVKKPHTNPSRVLVTLAANPAFTGTGTFERSSDRIRFFDAAVGGTEITFNGVDNVFTDAQLVAGVQLFAEGAAASASMNDVQLTLRLTVNGQAGLSDTRTMTALLLTLDIGLSRPGPGVEPPFMSEADKINVGRPVQTPDPASRHERAMLVVRQPQPADFVGDLVLTAMNGRVRAFTNEAPSAGQIPIANPLTIAAASIGAAGTRFFIEGVSASTAVRDTGYELGLPTEPEGDRVRVTVIQLEMIATPTAAAPALNFVRVGLWDNAFLPATGALRNARDAANNFVDLDSRRFYLRLRDPGAAGETRVQWRTIFENGAADDNRPSSPAAPNITVTETAAGSGIFISRAVMLVTSQTDRDQVTHSGLPAGHRDPAGNADDNNRGVGDSDHRIRRILVDDTHILDNRSQLSYTAMAGVTPFQISLPVFERAPEERRRVRVHLVDVRDRVGGTGSLGAVRSANITRTIREIYAVCGIYAEIDEFEIDPPASCVGWPQGHPDPAGVAADPGAEGFGFPGGVNLIPSVQQNDLINAVRARADFNINDLYIVFVNRLYNPITPANPNLATGNRGESFPDSWVAAGATSRSFTFVGVMNAPTDYTEAHEITHNTTNLRNSVGGHFDLAAGDLRDNRNLMRNGTVDGTGILDTRRLWDTDFANPAIAPAALPRQINAIRTSRFIRAF